MDTIQTLKIDVVLNGKKAQIGLKQLYKQLKGIEKPVKSINNLFGKMLKVAGFTGFAKMAFDAQKLGRELGLIANKTGIAASKISKMQNAFAATGGDAKGLTNVLTRITSGLARLSMGSGEMASKLSAMGINAWDSSGRVKTSDVVLGDIAEWTKGQLDMGRSMQEVSQFLQDNFGITQDLANQLALGRGGFAKYQAELAKKTGSLEESEISNLQSLNASLARLKQTVVVLSEKLMAGLAPAIEFVTDLFQFIFSEGQGVLSELFGAFSDLVNVFDGGDGLTVVFEALKTVIKGVADALKILIDLITLVLSAFRALGEELGKAFTWLAQKFSWLFGGSDPDKDVNDKKRQIMEMVKNGQMSPQQAAIALEKEGISIGRVARPRGYVAPKIEKVFSNDVIPQFPEIRLGDNGFELIGGGEIIIENNTTINANTNASAEDIGNAVSSKIEENSVPAIAKAGTGGF